MKKTLVALTIMGLSGASAVNAATSLYDKDGMSIDLSGRVEPRMSIQDGKAADESRARLGFTFKQQINPDIYAIGYYEGQFNSNTATDNDQGRPTYGPDGSKVPNVFNRYLFAGFGGVFGQVTYGKTEGALNQITDFTDIMAYHGASAATKLDVGDHTNNMLAYSGTYQGLTLKGSYKFTDRGVTITPNLEERFIGRSNNGYSLSALYALGDSGFKVGAGYADAKLSMIDNYDPTTLLNVIYEGRVKQTMAGASFEVANFYFGGLYINQHFKAANQSDYDSGNQNGYELATAYTFNKATFRASYNSLDNATQGGQKITSSNLGHKVKNLALDTSYKFMPNFMGYISYNFNLLKAKHVGKIDASDELALGMRYDF